MTYTSTQGKRERVHYLSEPRVDRNRTEWASSKNVFLTVRIIIFVSLQYLSFTATDLVHHTTWRSSSKPGLDAVRYAMSRIRITNSIKNLYNERVLLEEVPANLNHHASEQSISAWPSIHCGICSSHSCLFVASLNARARGRNRLGNLPLQMDAAAK